MRFVLLTVLAVSLSPAHAIDLVGVDLTGSISAEVDAFGNCGPESEFVNAIAPGATERLDLGSCGALDVAVEGHQILVTAVSSPPETEYAIAIQGIRFIAPENGLSVPIILRGNFNLSGFEGAAIGGIVGGGYTGPLGGHAPTFFVVGADSITLSTIFRANLDSPSSQTPTIFLEILTVALPECSDNLDNDGDRKIDARDKQCDSAADRSEAERGMQ